MSVLHMQTGSDWDECSTGGFDPEVTGGEEDPSRACNTAVQHAVQQHIMRNAALLVVASLQHSSSFVQYSLVLDMMQQMCCCVAVCTAQDVTSLMLCLPLILLLTQPHSNARHCLPPLMQLPSPSRCHHMSLRQWQNSQNTGKSA